jgi:tripartite-type tricarboxylate transporter receptor subunit TctC
MKKLFALLFAAVVSMTAQASDFPSKTVTIVTSFPVGAGPDGVVRAMSQELSKIWNQPVVVENRPGGNGVVSLGAFNQTPADGYTVYLTDPTVIYAYPLVYGKDDLTANVKTLIPSTTTDLVLVTSPAITNAKELQAAIQKSPSYGSWAIGSTSQMYASQVATVFGVTAQHLPYKDYGQWLTDVSNQQLGFSFSTMASAQALQRAGKLRFLAIAADERNSQYPDVPTIDELVGKKTGVYGPKTGAAFYIKKGTPAEAEAALRAGFRKAYETATVKEAIASRGYKRWVARDSEIERVMADDEAKYHRLIRQLNIKLAQ